MKQTRIRSRTLGVGLAVSSLAFVGALWMTWDVRSAQEADEALRQHHEIALVQRQEALGHLEGLAANAYTVADWGEVRRIAGVLSEEAAQHFGLRADLGTLEALADERDASLENAAALIAMNKNDPGIEPNMARAEKSHEHAQAVLQKLEREYDLEDDLEFLYRRAYETYRSLAFLEAGEANVALNLIDGALTDLKAFNAKDPKNNTVELAIEFLYERAQEEEARARQGSVASRPPDVGVPRALPSPSTGPQGGFSRTPRPGRH